MAVERANRINVPKPWGLTAASHWLAVVPSGPAIGEIWYDRTTGAAEESKLRLKVILTSAPLSIQVHPDDKYASVMGLANGKTEAWHVLAATPDARIAVGLLQETTTEELRQAVADERLSDLLHWRTARVGDTVLVPAGTIHAIGAGLVIAEIQQRSDATFRLSDHGRGRELHIEDALAVSNTVPTRLLPVARHINAERLLLVENSHFVFERLNLAADTAWCLEFQRETWLLVIDGSARVNSMQFASGDCAFAQSEIAALRVGCSGLTALVAYTGSDFVSHLLRPSEHRPMKCPPIPELAPVSSVQAGKVFQ